MALVNATGTWTGVAYQSTSNFSVGQKGEYDLPHDDRQVLRELAGKVAEEAARPAQQEERELWRRTDESTVRKVLREVLAGMRGCRLQIIMKDTHTLGNNQRNAVRWVEINREEIERAAL
jgi:hypothetical protein